MAFHLKVNGMRELMADLRRLPAHLRDEGRTIAQQRVNEAESQILARYMLMRKSELYGVKLTGNLAAGLQQSFESPGGQRATGAYGVRLVLTNRAKHAYLVEIGTDGARRTDKGWNRGKMPAAHAFIPAVIRARRLVVEDLIALVERAGLRVRGG
jgi:hypothetical protein